MRIKQKELLNMKLIFRCKYIEPRGVQIVYHHTEFYRDKNGKLFKNDIQAVGPMFDDFKPFAYWRHACTSNEQVFDDFKSKYKNLLD